MYLICRLTLENHAWLWGHVNLGMQAPHSISLLWQVW